MYFQSSITLTTSFFHEIEKKHTNKMKRGRQTTKKALGDGWRASGCWESTPDGRQRRRSITKIYDEHNMQTHGCVVTFTRDREGGVAMFQLHGCEGERASQPSVHHLTTRYSLSPPPGGPALGPPPSPDPHTSHSRPPSRDGRSVVSRGLTQRNSGFTGTGPMRRLKRPPPAEAVTVITLFCAHL